MNASNQLIEQFQVEIKQLRAEIKQLEITLAEEGKLFLECIAMKNEELASVRKERRITYEFFAELFEEKAAHCRQSIVSEAGEFTVVLPTVEKEIRLQTGEVI